MTKTLKRYATEAAIVALTFAALFAVCVASPANAGDVKISALPAASAVAASDVFPVTQGTCPSCATNGATGTQMKTWAQSGLATVATSGSAADLTGTLGLTHGGTGQTTAAGARGSSGLNIDAITTHGDSAYTIVATDRVVATSATLTASRTWTLPAASALNAGQILRVVDQAGGIAGANTLVIARAGSDTINGASTSITLSAAYGAVDLVSDGSSKWSLVGASRLTACSTHQFQTGSTAAAGPTCAQPSTSDISGLATVASSGSAADLGSGTLPAARLGGMSAISNYLSGDVAMGTTSTFFSGPAIAQGSSGTWWVTATITIQDSTAANNNLCKLWDGTTIITTAALRANNAGVPFTVSLSGLITSPAGNLRVDCEPLTTTTSSIKAATAIGGNNASMIQAIRIG